MKSADGVNGWLVFRSRRTWHSCLVVDVPPLVQEAMKKAGLVWLRVPGADQPTAAWVSWQDGVAYLVTGPGEQPAPGLAAADRCDVTVPSAERGGRIVTWQAAVTRLEPDSEEWTAAVPGLVGKRLNLTDQEATPSRWATECAVLRLAPTGELTEAGDTLPTGSLAEPPLPSPARTPTRRPVTLGRGARRRRSSTSPR